jgi:hypothetical protein
MPDSRNGLSNHSLTSKNDFGDRKTFFVTNKSQKWVVQSFARLVRTRWSDAPRLSPRMATRILRSTPSAFSSAGDLGSRSGIATDSYGFCGATIVGQSCLTTALNLDKKATTKLLSNCPLFPGENMPYGAADKGSKKNPSTNLPVLCQEGGCVQAGVTYWRHNVSGHCARAYAGLAVTTTVSEQ